MAASWRGSRARSTLAGKVRGMVTLSPAAAIHNLHRVGEGEGEGEGCGFGGLANRPTAMARATYCAMQ